jgi:outer membrane biosynthesis protein TonB
MVSVGELSPGAFSGVVRPDRRRWSAPGLITLAAHGLLLALGLLARVAPEVPAPPPEPILTLHLAAAGPAHRESPAHPPSPHRAARRSPRRAFLAPPVLVAPPAAPQQPPEENDDGGAPEGDDSKAGGTGDGNGTGDGTDGPALWKPEEHPVSGLEAAYLRLYQTFPSLPRALWVRGRVYTVRVQMCISAAGDVYDVALRQSASPALDALVISTLRTWRYRARLVDGKPRAFCHPMVLHYDVD